VEGGSAPLYPFQIKCEHGAPLPVLSFLPVIAHAVRFSQEAGDFLYTDFQCGACTRFNSEIEPELRKRYEAIDKAQIEIRLLGAMGPESMRAAEAALSAGHQGKFSEYTDALFRAYADGEDIAVFSVEALTQLAAELGLQEAAFANCLESEAKRVQVEENMNMAQADAVSTLPAVLVGDSGIEGRQPLAPASWPLKQRWLPGRRNNSR
jgi:protein-disulfide isomerase